MPLLKEDHPATAAAANGHFRLDSVHLPGQSLELQGSLEGCFPRDALAHPSAALPVRSPPLGTCGNFPSNHRPEPSSSLGSQLATTVSGTSAVPSSSDSAVLLSASCDNSDNNLMSFTVFDTTAHSRTLRIPRDATLAEIVAEALRSSEHLPAPLAFRVLQHTLPGLPVPQLVVWTEPNHGHRVLPIGVDDHVSRVCTVNVPFDATPFAIAIEMELRCAGVNRLRYQIAHRAATLLADGARTEPFLAGQHAGADWGLISARDAHDPLPAISSYMPASFLQPSELTEARFASRSNEVIVHRMGCEASIVEAQQDLGPQALLTRLLNALNLHPSARLCFPAVMPVEVPCRLHVVVGTGPRRS